MLIVGILTNMFMDPIVTTTSTGQSINCLLSRIILPI